MGVGVVEVAAASDRTGPLALHVSAIVVLGLAVALRRVRPVAATTAGGMAVAVQCVGGWAGSAAELVLFLLLVLAAGALPGTRARASCLLLLSAVYVGVLLRDPSTHSFASALPSLVLFAAAASTGVVLAERAASAAAMVARAERARATAEQQSAQQLAEERNRLARELHDVVTHSLSVVVVQAGAARLDAPPEQAQRLVAIEETARTALAEMRRLLGVLRGEPGTDLSPQPGLEQLPGLVAQLRAAGIIARIRSTGPARPLAPGLDLTAYRVAQEATTNVLTHADAHEVLLALDWHPDRLIIRVCDDGSPVRDAATGGGRGLVGLAERTALYGGSLTHGPRPGGGYDVRAELPLVDTPTPAEL